MLSYICVKQDFTARWLPDILWMAIFYKKKKLFQFSHVTFKCKLLISALRPYSIFWMATFQILTKSLFVYESANSVISITKFYAGVTSACIIWFIIIPISDLRNQTADSEVTIEMNSQLWNRSYIHSYSYCVTKTVCPWLKGTKWPRM